VADGGERSVLLAPPRLEGVALIDRRQDSIGGADERSAQFDRGEVVQCKWPSREVQMRVYAAELDAGDTADGIADR
jgi:hypothetical protein